MYWTLELASSLDDAPWPATKEELIDYANRSGAPEEVIENLQELEEDNEIYESIEDIWPDYPSKDDFFWNEEEYYQVKIGKFLIINKLKESLGKSPGFFCVKKVSKSGFSRVFTSPRTSPENTVSS